MTVERGRYRSVAEAVDHAVCTRVFNSQVG